jgi:PRTRC genetic system protein C
MEVKQITRKFTFNGIDLKDPGAALTAEQVKEFYTAVYPELTNAEVEGPEHGDGTETYTFLRAVGTKGNSLGAQLIAAERQRQIDAEGWDAAHDDQHRDGGMAIAAACYAAKAGWESALRARIVARWLQDTQDFITFAWPWERKWWKPRDRIANLVRAGALIAAEIDRLQRSEAKRAEA